jgi:hypothetical protein
MTQHCEAAVILIEAKAERSDTTCGRKWVKSLTSSSRLASGFHGEARLSGGRRKAEIRGSSLRSE